MNVFSVPPGARARAGRMHRGRGLAGYTRIWSQGEKFAIGWRWKNEKRWHMGSVRTRDEMEALRKAIRECLERGEDPGPLPSCDLRAERHQPAQDTPATPAERAERRAIMARQLAPDAPRCPHCSMLSPCAPCPGDPATKHEMRSARRER